MRSMVVSSVPDGDNMSTFRLNRGSKKMRRNRKKGRKKRKPGEGKGQ